MSIFSKPNKFLKTPKSAVKVRTEKAKPAAKEQAEKVKPAAKEQAEKAPASGTLNSPNLDSDIEALQNDLKRRDEAKGR